MDAHGLGSRSQPMNHMNTGNAAETKETRFGSDQRDMMGTRDHGQRQVLQDNYCPKYNTTMNDKALTNSKIYAPRLYIKRKIIVQPSQIIA